MAKTESTAVNELIDLVQQGKKPQAEPGADLFSAPKSTTVQPPPRMTSTLPPMRGAGEVAPLPRVRAPQSTSQHGMPAIPPPVRMSTAEPPTGNTIPPISRPTRPSGQLPRPQVRASSPLPPPRNTLRSTGSVPSLPSLPPPSAPVAAPFEARPSVPQQYPILPQPQVEDNWFDVSAKVAKMDEQTWVGTAPVPKRNDTLVLVKKMIAPTIVLAIIGVMVGGFFAFDGDGGKKKKTAAAAPAEQKLEMTAAPAAVAAVAPAVVPAAEPAAPSAEAPVAAEPPTKEEAVATQAAAKEAETAAMTQEAPAEAKARLDEKLDKIEAKLEKIKEQTEAPVAVKKVATSGAPAPVREIKTSQGVIKQVDVRIDSKPTGATVMLVDDGKTSFLGSTPLATSVDPSRTYDVIFTYPGRPTQMAPLDPKKSSRLDVTLGRAKSRSKNAEAAPPSSKLADAFFEEPAKKVAEKKAEEPKAEKKVVEKKAIEPKVEQKAIEPKIEAKPAKKPTADIDDEDPLAKGTKPEKKLAEKKVAAPKADAGEGTLMVSSKPPCEIHIDGKPTGLTTPQRSITLPVGAHKITFVNEAEGIKKTVSVSITADQTTKLIQDLMKK